MGVAIALAADSWRESLLERDAEREYLSALSADMLRAQATLDEVIFSTSSNHAQLDSFIRLVASEAPLEDSVNAVGLNLPRLAIPTGMLDALVSGGAIQLVQDPELRAAIVSARADLAYELHWLDQLAAEGLANFREWLVMRSVLRAAGGRTDGDPRASAARDSPEFQGQYRYHSNNLVNQLRSMERMRVAIQRLLDTLE